MTTDAPDLLAMRAVFFLQVLMVIAGAAAAWLVPRYLVRCVEEAARGVVDLSVGKELAEHRLLIDKKLELYRSLLSLDLERTRQTLALERDRYGHDYSHFSRRRSEVYAETYALVERARGAFFPHFARIQERADYSRASARDLRELLTTLNLPRSDHDDLHAALDSGRLEDARRLAARLTTEVSLVAANAAFYAFRNSIVVNALYFSDQVNDELTRIIDSLSMLSVYADEILHDDAPFPQDGTGHLEQLGRAVAQLRDLMRAELQPTVAAMGARSDAPSDA
jgi:hypothetical protein